MPSIRPPSPQAVDFSLEFSLLTRQARQRGARRAHIHARRQPVDGRQPTLREVLAIHREKPLCASCHNRMDPLGLALENFNALGMWREKERGQPIDAAGKLITGETFTESRTEAGQDRASPQARRRI